MIEVRVSVIDAASPALRKFIAGLTGPQAAEMNEQGGRAAVTAAVAYHREYDQAGGWRGKRYLGTGQEGTGFGADVARGWFFKEAGRGGAVIANNADHYAFKVSGGTIRPKRVKYLTIPLIAEARGLMTAVYTQNTGHKLFTMPGKSALFEQHGAGVRAVYALVRSVTMGPWPGAVPPEPVLADAFIARWKTALAELIESTP